MIVRNFSFKTLGTGQMHITWNCSFLQFETVAASALITSCGVSWHSQRVWNTYTMNLLTWDLKKSAHEQDYSISITYSNCKWDRR